MHRLTPVDAQMYWLSAEFPNDAFLLYGFDGVPDVDEAVEGVLRRARVSPDLTVRVQDRGALRYPVWARCDLAPDQVEVHALGAPTWSACLTELVGLMDVQVDAQAHPWRMHVFPGVSGVPGCGGPGTVVVVQMSHALADGIRSSELAATLFGRRDEVPRARPLRWGVTALPWRTVLAVRAHRELLRDNESGVVSPGGGDVPALRTNTTTGPRAIRTVTRSRTQFAGPTVTVAVLSAVSAALSEQLRELGESTASLGAEVPMAKAGVRLANNHFGNVGVGLYPQLEPGERRDRIAADLAARRRRAAHPANLAAARAFAASPPGPLRWGVRRLDPTTRSDTVTGNTVVSSVNRGAADLTFGGGRVTVTAGYPALSPMMGLAHGVHGIGDTVAVSVHAAESAIGDIDAYVVRLEAALGD